MKIEDLKIYQISMELGENIWIITTSWNSFEKYTIGMQLIRAVDSISANLSEGFGRYFYKEERQFCFYARGSLFETKTWITKAYNRKLIKETTFNELSTRINDLGVRLNNYIKTIGNQKRYGSTERQPNDN